LETGALTKLSYTPIAINPLILLSLSLTLQFRIERITLIATGATEAPFCAYSILESAVEPSGSGVLTGILLQLSLTWL
jgi:hypothetical protein